MIAPYKIVDRLERMGIEDTSLYAEVYNLGFKAGMEMQRNLEEMVQDDEDANT